MDEPEGTAEGRTGRGVETGLRILDFLAGWTDLATLPRPRTAALHDIASDLAIPEPTAYRMLAAMTRAGWVEKVGGEYRLTFKLGLIGVRIHEALRRQVESCSGMVCVLDGVKESSGAGQ